ncbi:putative cytochrome P450 [Dactylonectria macrodidyma]|uniref:Cytochrome P450 n=1 Tax=Dactylonectria macrodidyma TaxID=307937 RepID=A0A9P9F4S1_9HYPO|nr:putative cytochrome P450 [Dactylonectria macrodidyma]
MSPLHWVVSTYLNTNVAYKVLLGLFISLLCHRLTYKPKQYKLFPIWATVEVAIASYVLRGPGLGYRVLRHGGSLFGVSRTHQVLVNLPNIDRLLSQSVHTINAEPVQYTLFTRVFGGVDSPALNEKLGKSWKDLLVPIERLFLNDAAATAAIERAHIPQQAASFVTFSSDPANMKRWELSADARVISPSLPGKVGVVEANLQSLTRDFGACSVIPLLYGMDFLDRCPKLLDDFWKFDNELFPLLMIGIPTWAPFKLVREGIKARSRILSELDALYQRVDRSQQEGALDVNADLLDVSSVPFERNKVYVREGWSFAERAAGDFAVFWGQNANTHPVLFWFLTYVYSTPGLLGRVRDEIFPFITLSDSDPFKILAMDIPALCRHSQLLKACIFETYRMANEPTSIRYVARHITIHDGELDHHLEPGTFISAPHSLVNQNPLIFADPEKFLPDRFLETDAQTGKLVARYGRLRPWGTGTSMCKGRTFAEKQIMSAGAAIISLWDIKPVGGIWKLPAMIPGTGVKKPVKDIRVQIERRVL